MNRHNRALHHHFRLQRDGQRYWFTSAISLSHAFNTPISITNNLYYTTRASAPNHLLSHDTLSDRVPTPSPSTSSTLLPRFLASDCPSAINTRMNLSVFCPLLYASIVSQSHIPTTCSEMIPTYGPNVPISKLHPLFS